MKQHAKRASWARVLLVPTLLLGSASMAAFPVHAAQVELNQTVTLQMRKVKLADVFKKLSNLSGYEFFYDESVVQKYNMIDIDLDNVSIIRKSKFPQNPKRSVRFSGKRTKRSVQKRKARNTQKAETKVL